MGKARVFQTRGLVLDSQRITVVSGRASDLKCSCATLVQVRRPVLILEITKLSNINVSDKVSQGIETINERQFMSLTFSHFSGLKRYSCQDM